MKANKLIFLRALFGIILLLCVIGNPVRGLPFITMCLSIVIVNFIPLKLLLNKAISVNKNAF